MNLKVISVEITVIVTISFHPFLFAHRSGVRPRLHGQCGSDQRVLQETTTPRVRSFPGRGGDGQRVLPLGNIGAD